MTPLLVLGGQGQVAREIGRVADRFGFAPTFAGRETVDLLTEDGLELLASTPPAAGSNAAAYTAVDKAEQEADAAFRLNRDIPRTWATACADAGVAFVHISTDYVFDGSKPTPYAEDDPIRPLGAYGESKAAGEAAVLAAGGDFAIVRTAWVYSAHGANFVRTMLRVAGQRDEVGVVDDQRGCPTWAGDVAEATLRLALRLRDSDRGARGVFHAAGEGEATWADFAEVIFAGSAARGGPAARVKRITTADYPTPARRPANSRLDSAKLERTLGWRPPPWRERLGPCLDQLLASAAAYPRRGRCMDGPGAASP
jgi:dTDP-4-dehydrorhamnose reductase